MKAACRPLASADDQRERRDDGLAAADVALQQALHRLRAREVGGRISSRARRCAAVSANGAERIEASAQRRVENVALRLARGQHARARQLDARAQSEQLAVGQTLVRRRGPGVERLDVGVGRGPVQGPQRGGERGQTVARSTSSGTVSAAACSRSRPSRRPAIKRRAWRAERPGNGG